MKLRRQERQRAGEEADQRLRGVSALRRLGAVGRALGASRRPRDTARTILANAP